VKHQIDKAWSSPARERDSPSRMLLRDARIRLCLSTTGKKIRALPRRQVKDCVRGGTRTVGISSFNAGAPPRVTHQAFQISEMHQRVASFFRLGRRRRCAVAQSRAESA
jgi:hypothetical protein